jgi:hypothetical protein
MYTVSMVQPSDKAVLPFHENDRIWTRICKLNARPGSPSTFPLLYTCKRASMSSELLVHVQVATMAWCRIGLGLGLSLPFFRCSGMHYIASSGTNKAKCASLHLVLDAAA